MGKETIGTVHKIFYYSISFSIDAFVFLITFMVIGGVLGPIITGGSIIFVFFPLLFFAHGINLLKLDDPRVVKALVWGGVDSIPFLGAIIPGMTALVHSVIQENNKAYTKRMQEESKRAQEEFKKRTQGRYQEQMLAFQEQDEDTEIANDYSYAQREYEEEEEGTPKRDVRVGQEVYS